MDSRLKLNHGTHVYTGNELLVKGALEAGTGLITGYPGSPIAEVFEVASSNHELLESLGVMAQMANNEALAAARLNGSQMEDIRAMALMKSVGFHVAADGLALGNLSKSGKRGGALVVVGDDPWSETTQVPVDSRRLADHLFMPVLEPSNHQEMKDWIEKGYQLSAYAETYVMYLVTATLADGGSAVNVGPNKDSKIRADSTLSIHTSEIKIQDAVILPPRTGRREVEMIRDKWPRIISKARELGLSWIEPGEEGASLGFVASGMAYTYLRQALDILNLSGKYPILRLGLTFPLDQDLLKEFSLQVGSIVVVEEKRRFLEEKIKDALTDFYQEGHLPRYVPVWGKKFPNDQPGFPETYGLNPSVVMKKIGALVLNTEDTSLPVKTIEKELERIVESGLEEMAVPLRTPTFCPGCPHRDSSTVLMDLTKDLADAQYMRKNHDREPTDLIFHGDTGCYSMYMYEPNENLMHNYSGMGLGGGTGAGIDPFISNKQLVFMGDGTFFHSGMSAISDAIKHRQDITFIILDNKTTAMTGHQPTPGTDKNLMDESTFAQDIESILLGMTKGAGIPIHRVNPEDRVEYRSLVEELVLQDGVKVVIADKECGITFHRRRKSAEALTIREKGFLSQEKVFNITPEVCENCLECTKVTGCPGLEFVPTPYGPKVATSRTTCVSDGACARIKACPSFEEIQVNRRGPMVYPKLEGEDSECPEPARVDLNGVFSTYVSGVGGMGIGTVTAILVRAGLGEGYQVQFCDKKGLAIRNGGVFSHVIYAEKDKNISPIIPYGHADILLGIDLLEAARALDPRVPARVVHPDRTRAVLNRQKTSTVRHLMGLDDWSVDELVGRLDRRTLSGGLISLDVSAFCEEYLGSSVYANILMLGIAFQKGWLPLGWKALTEALKDTVGNRALETNLRALKLGRLLAEKPRLAQLHSEEFNVESLESVVRDREARLGSKRQKFRELIYAYCGGMAHLKESVRAAFALRVFDLIRWGGFGYAQTYMDVIIGVYRKDRLDYEFQATEAAVEGLHKAMLIKDEVYVAYLLTSDEKHERDMRRLRLNPKAGDRIRYKHFNRPQFTIFRQEIAFNIETRDWQLRIMKHMKFLRTLLPGWHRKEKAFRSWYLSLVRGFGYRNGRSYKAYVEALQLIKDVKGYRDIRYPKMDEVINRAGEILRDASDGLAEKKAAGPSRV